MTEKQLGRKQSLRTLKKHLSQLQKELGYEGISVCLTKQQGNIEGQTQFGMWYWIPCFFAFATNSYSSEYTSRAVQT